MGSLRGPLCPSRTPADKQLPGPRAWVQWPLLQMELYSSLQDMLESVPQHVTSFGKGTLQVVGDSEVIRVDLSHLLVRTLGTETGVTEDDVKMGRSVTCPSMEEKLRITLSTPTLRGSGLTDPRSLTSTPRAMRSKLSVALTSSLKHWRLQT